MPELSPAQAAVQFVDLIQTADVPRLVTYLAQVEVNKDKVPAVLYRTVLRSLALRLAALVVSPQFMEGVDAGSQ